MYSNLHLTISGLSFFYISYTHSTQYMMFQSQPATFFLMRPAVSYDPFRKLIRPLSITSSHWLVGTLAMSCFCSLFLFGAAAAHCLLHNTGAKLHSCMHPKHGQSMRTHTQIPGYFLTFRAQSVSKSLIKTFSEVHGLF